MRKTRKFKSYIKTATERAELTEKTQINIHDKLYEDLTERIIKLSIEAHKTLGPGFMESVYENALIYKMKKEGLKFEEQKIIISIWKTKKTY